MRLMLLRHVWTDKLIDKAFCYKDETQAMDYSDYSLWPRRCIGLERKIHPWYVRLQDVQKEAVEANLKQDGAGRL